MLELSPLATVFHSVPELVDLGYPGLLTPIFQGIARIRLAVESVLGTWKSFVDP
jgi:hypothetical protein